MDRQDLSRYAGNEAQIFGARRVTLEEGLAKGASLIEVRNGAGLYAEVCADNGLDLGLVSVRGVNVSYLSRNGYVSPYRFNSADAEFQYNLTGGMMFTCGLRNAGGSNTYEGVWNPKHGRYHFLPATGVAGYVEDDRIVVRGIIAETLMQGYALRVERTWIFPLFENKIILEDAITNAGDTATPIMLAYHWNFGYPFISPHTRLRLPEDTETSALRQPEAYAGRDMSRDFREPIPGLDEEVYLHETKGKRVELENPDVALRADLCWEGETLNALAQWKMMTSGEYVLGIEVMNCRLQGLKRGMEQGELCVLAPHERTVNRLTLTLDEVLPQ